MATSLIKFSQGATNGTSGWAFVATTGSAVTVVNNDNTGVNSWQIELVDVPSGSAVSTGIIAHSDAGSTPTITVTPDVAGGCYRFVLKVWNAINRVGAADDTDIRNVVVLDSRGFASPPSQIWPLPLPPTASGMPGNKPNELNINGQERGYAGAGTDGLLDQRFNSPVITNINVSAGTTSRNLSALVFSNSNNVTFGLSGSTITGSISAPVQTNQTIGLYGLGNTTQNSSTTLDARTLSFNGLGIVTVGYSNGSIQISATSAAQTVQTSNIVVPSAGTQTATSGTVVFSNSNGFSFGMSGSSRITASYTVPSTAGLISAVNLSAGTTSNNLSAVTFSNSNGVSFGLNGSVVTGSVATSLTGVNLSAGTTSNNLSAFVFSNSNNVSFGLNGSTVTATVTVPAQTNQTEGRYAIGNTVGQSSSSTFDARTLSVSGAGIASVGYSNNALVISVPAAGGSINFSAGTTSNNLNAITFSNSNNVSFGLNGSTLTGSIATSLTGVNLSAGTTSNNLSAFVFSNSNNVSFGLNGSTVTATVTVPTQTVQTVGLYGLGNTTQNSSTTLDARTLSFNGLGIVTVGYSNGSIQISATTAAQTNQTEGRYAIGNTVGQSSSSTFDARTMSISGAGIASVGYSGNALVISVPSAGGSVNFSAGTTSNNLNAITFSNSNNVSFGLNGSTLTGSVATSLTGVNLSAGTTSNNLSAFVFSNSNNVTFGLNGSTVTASVTVTYPAQTVQTIGLYGLGNTTQNSSTTLDARTLSFNGAGIITVGYSNGSIQLSATTAAQTAQTQNIVVPTAGTQTATSGTVVFANSNGISFGMSGSSQITASYTVPSVPAQTAQTVGLYALGNTTQNSSTTLDARTISYNGLGIVTVGYSNGSVQISATTVAQTNQTEGRYVIGNTTGQSSSSTFDARTLSISGAGGVSVGYSGNALVISGGAAGGSVNFSAGTTSNNLNAITFSNSNGVSFGLNGSTLTGSVATSLTGVNISAGTTSNNLSAFVFSNSNNVSFGLNGSTVTATITVPAQTVQTVGLYALGNTTQNSSTTFDARTLSFNGLGGITVGYSNGSIQLSGPQTVAQTIQTSNIVVPSAGTQTATSGTVVFANSNGISFGMSGSSQITASYTVPTQSNQSIGLYALGNTTQNSSTTLDARTLSFNGAGIVTVGYSNGSIQISATTVAQSNQTQGLYALGNTTGQSSSSTFDARTLSISGAGIASVGYSGNALVISVPTGAPSPVNFSAGTTSGNLGSVVFSNSNGVSFGLNGSTITASAAGGGQTTAGFYALGNTTQNSSTTLALNSISFNGIGALTVGYSNSSIQLSAPATSSLVGVGGLIVSTNGSTISVSGPSLTNYEPFPPTATTVFTAGQNSWYFEPFEMPGNLSGGRINRIINFTSTAGIFVATTSASFGTGTSGSHSGNFVYANTLALYSLGTGTNSTRLESFWSNSFSVGLKQSVSISQAGGTAISVTQAGTISFIQSINSAGAYTTASSTASVTLSTASSVMASTALTSGLSTLRNLLSGVLLIPVGFNTTILPGNYWLGQGQSTTITTAGTNHAIWSYSNQSGISVAVVSSPRVWGQTATTTGALFPGRGVYSAATASPPATIGFTQINTIGGTQQYFNWINSTI